MPLDDFQKRIARIIAPNRTERSVFAGGSMLQRHGFRLSGDSDIFHQSLDVHDLFAADLSLLQNDGIYVEKTRDFPGFIEAIVSSADENEAGSTRLQWVTEGLNNFFTPVKDEEVGFRLHFADLAVNKLLACAGRKEARDFVDLWMVDRFSMPVWRLAVAAPGKDIRWSPLSILERVSANMVFSEQDFQNDLLMTVEIDPGGLMRELTESVDRAKEVVSGLEDSVFGKLAASPGWVFVDALPVDCIQEWISPEPGGNRKWEDHPDTAMTEKLVEAFGLDGRGITDSLTFP